MINKIIEQIKEITGVRTAFDAGGNVIAVHLEESPLCFNCKKEPATRGLNKPKLCSTCWNNMVDETNIEQS
jgi:hypothetical protein